MRLGLSVSAVGAGPSGVGSSAPTAPVLSLSSQANGSITVDWTNTGADTYRLYVDGALAQSGITGTMATASGLTNFQDYNITVRAVVGGVESADSNTVTAYPTYGPVTIAPGTNTLTLDGSWTAGTALWGAVSLPVGIEMQADWNGFGYNSLYGYTGSGAWEDEILSGDATDNPVEGQIEISNSSGSPFTIWVGRPMPI